MTRYSEALNKRGIFEHWHSKQWDDYTGDENKNKVINHLKDERERGLILYGTNGTGKTMLMNLAMKDLFISLKQSVFVIDFRHLVQAYTATWRGDFTEMDKVLGCKFLGIDDIGKEFKSGDVSKELACTTLDYVIRYRFQRNRPTWITMNLQLSEISSSYNEHIASLLKRCCNAVKIEGGDFGDNLFKKK